MMEMTPAMLVGLALLSIIGLAALSLILSDDALAMWRIRLRRYYRVGDTVTLGEGFHGRVSALGLFTTTLLTPSGERIWLSNRAVLSWPIIVHPADAAPVTLLAAATPTGEAPQLATPADSPTEDETSTSQPTPDLAVPAPQMALEPIVSDALVEPAIISSIEPAPVVPSPPVSKRARLEPLPVVALLKRSPLGQHTLRPLRGVPLPTIDQLPSTGAAIVSATAPTAAANKPHWLRARLRQRAALVKPE